MNNTKLESLITFYKNELNNKDRIIDRLNKKIDSLINDNKDLQSKIQLMKFENFKLKEYYDKLITLESMKSKTNIDDNKIYIDQLKNDNNKLKNVIYNYENIPPIARFQIIDNNTNCYNCNNLKEQIYNLEIINRKDEEILAKVLNFINFLYKKYNGNDDLHVDLITMETNIYEFKRKLDLIQNNILEKSRINL